MARIRCFRTINYQHTIEQGNLCGHLYHFASSGVEGAFGRTDEQSQEYRGHRRNESQRQFHRVFRLSDQLLGGKERTETTSHQRDGDEDYEQGQGNSSNSHYCIFGYVEWLVVCARVVLTSPPF